MHTRPSAVFVFLAATAAIVLFSLFLIRATRMPAGGPQPTQEGIGPNAMVPASLSSEEPEDESLSYVEAQELVDTAKREYAASSARRESLVHLDLPRSSMIKQDLMIAIDRADLGVAMRYLDSVDRGLELRSFDRFKKADQEYQNTIAKLAARLRATPDD